MFGAAVDSGAILNRAKKISLKLVFSFGALLLDVQH